MGGAVLKTWAGTASWAAGTAEPAAPIWPTERSWRLSSGSQFSANRVVRRVRSVDAPVRRSEKDRVGALKFPPPSIDGSRIVFEGEPYLLYYRRRIRQQVCVTNFR